MKIKAKLAILSSALLLLGLAGYLWQAGFLLRSAPLEKITIGTNLNDMLGLLFIAETRGYYQEQGLKVIINSYQTGLGPLRDLKAGRLDLASCAEFALVGEIFAGGAGQLRCLAVIGSGEVDLLIARRDKGVNRPEDLRGKTIGLPRKTSAEFFLGRFLTLNHISLKEVTVINIKPLALADALAAGEVDAVLIWAPLTQDIIKKVGPNAIAWPAQGGQNVYRLLMTREEYIKIKPAVLEKLLRALAQAADYLKHQPEAGRVIIAQRLKESIDDLQPGKFPVNLEPLLDQGLLLVMEDEARWMIQNRLTTQTKVPNYLDYIYAEPLAKVDLKAVRIIIPKDERAVAPTPVGTGQEHR
ncbi:MAG: ABC transporter substrate-binding protein [Desulfobaccales bacterium]